MQLLKDAGTDFLARHPSHAGERLRIVRTADSYWIAPHAGGHLITVYEQASSNIHAWGRRYLHHPDQNLGRLQRLPVHHTPEQAITADLYDLWVLEA
ncbi:MAG: hypothetical protein H0U69_06110 [Trueperaceae bacterium]|nr:hypothetical protein [Trueperaceae bacterium]